MKDNDDRLIVGISDINDDKYTDWDSDNDDVMVRVIAKVTNTPAVNQVNAVAFVKSALRKRTTNLHHIYSGKVELGLASYRVIILKGGLHA